MKHGRPPRGSWDETYEGRGSTRWTEHRLCVGWRREHAHRVWQAMQAVVCLAVIDTLHEEQGRALNYGSDADRKAAYDNFRRCARLAGWDSNATGGGHG